jgi:hypothetical protein
VYRKPKTTPQDVPPVRRRTFELDPPHDAEGATESAEDACGPERVHRVVLLEEESVADRGRRSTLWYVKTGGSWQRPSAMAGAAADQGPSAARIVWARRWVLALAEGTLLMRCDTRPAQQERREPLELLLGRYGSHEQRVRRYYRVCARGELVLERGRS